MSSTKQLAEAVEGYDTSATRESFQTMLDQSREFADCFLATVRQLSKAGVPVPRKVVRAAKKLKSSTTPAEYHMGQVLDHSDTIVAWLASLSIGEGEQDDG